MPDPTLHKLTQRQHRLHKFVYAFFWVALGVLGYVALKSASMPPYYAILAGGLMVSLGLASLVPRVRLYLSSQVRLRSLYAKRELYHDGDLLDVQLPELLARADAAISDRYVWRAPEVDWTILFDDAGAVAVIPVTISDGSETHRANLIAVRCDDVWQDTGIRVEEDPDFQTALELLQAKT